MHGRVSRDPYKLASQFREVPDTVYQKGGWVCEVYGTGGLGVVIQTTPQPTAGASLEEAERILNNTPSLKGYHL